MMEEPRSSESAVVAVEGCGFHALVMAEARLRSTMRKAHMAEAGRQHPPQSHLDHRWLPLGIARHEVSGPPRPARATGVPFHHRRRQQRQAPRRQMQAWLLMSQRTRACERTPPPAAVHTEACANGGASRGTGWARTGRARSSAAPRLAQEHDRCAADGAQDRGPRRQATRRTTRRSRVCGMIRRQRGLAARARSGGPRRGPARARDHERRSVGEPPGVRVRVRGRGAGVCCMRARERQGKERRRSRRLRRRMWRHCGCA